MSDNAQFGGETPTTHYMVDCPTWERDRDAARYRFIRDNLAQVSSVHMDGTKHYHLRYVRGMHHSFDEAIDHMRAGALPTFTDKRPYRMD